MQAGLVIGLQQMSKFGMDRRSTDEEKIAPDGMTYEEIAQEFGISRQRVYQIEQVAIRKIRTYLHRNPDMREELISFLIESKERDA